MKLCQNLSGKNTTPQPQKSSVKSGPPKRLRCRQLLVVGGMQKATQQTYGSSIHIRCSWYSRHFKWWGIYRERWRPWTVRGRMTIAMEEMLAMAGPCKHRRSIWLKQELRAINKLIHQFPNNNGSKMCLHLELPGILTESRNLSHGRASSSNDSSQILSPTNSYSLWS